VSRIRLAEEIRGGNSFKNPFPSTAKGAITLPQDRSFRDFFQLARTIAIG